VRYSKEHKAQAKAAILQATSHTLKEKGFHAVGVDGLAASAQVTSGALYSNFANKEALLEELVSAQLGSVFADLDGAADPAERRHRLEEILRMYLSDEHREAVAQGCVMPSLSADVSRASASVREAYQRKMAELVARLTPAMPGAPEEREQRAWTVVASIVGAVTVARALPAGDQARAILDATLKSVTGAIADMEG
jgi:TetR/AcrR family transcriptional repressor of nem operon